MRWIGEMWRRLLFALRRRSLERDLTEEIGFHLDMRATEDHEAGLSEHQAQWQARREFGNVLRVREESSDVWGWAVLDRWRQDLRWAVRTLRRSRGLTIASVATLALGIGANTAIFTVVNAVLVRPLPYRNAERLVQVFQVSRTFGRSEASESVFNAWQARTRTLDAMAAFTSDAQVFVGGSSAEEVVGGRVTSGFFSILGVQPYRGRLLNADDGRASGQPVIVLSFGAWQRLLGGRESAIGQAVMLGGKVRTVVGVLPPGFRFEPLERRMSSEPAEIGFWAPLSLTATGNAATTTYYLRTLARLRPGMPIERARAELVAIAAQMTAGASFADVGSLQEELVHGSRRPLLFLLAAVGVVLLIACANVAHLQLAKGMARGREIAIRIAVGAGRGRLIRQILVESLVVAAMGAALGLAGAYMSLGALVRLAGPDLPRADQVHVDLIVLLFTALAATSSAMAFGLVAALRMSSTDPVHHLKGGEVTASGARANARLTRVLVAGEIGLALVLVVCAALMLTSLWAVENVPLGFSTEHLLTMRTVLPYQRYRGQSARFYHQALEMLRHVPGVEAADAANTLPMGGTAEFQGFVVAGTGADASVEARIRGQYRTVTPGYFRTMRIPLTRGRQFTDADRQDTAPVVIVNELAERRHFGGNAVGKRIYSGEGDEPFEVVGVVGDIRHAYARSEPLPEVYYPAEQSPRTRMWLVVRTNGDPLALAETVRKAIAAEDSSIVIDSVRTMAERRAASLGVSEFLAYLLIAFAGLALLLAVVGDYGVVSYSVARRTREIGVRLAFGATRGSVLTMVLRETVAVAAIAVAVAVPVALFSSRLLSSYLFGVSPGDVRVLAAAGATMLAAAVTAALVPAWHASRLDPMTALRRE